MAALDRVTTARLQLVPSAAFSLERITEAERGADEFPVGHGRRVAAGHPLTGRESAAPAAVVETSVVGLTHQRVAAVTGVADDLLVREPGRHVLAVGDLLRQWTSDGSTTRPRAPCLIGQTLDTARSVQLVAGITYVLHFVLELVRIAVDPSVCRRCRRRALVAHARRELSRPRAVRLTKQFRFAGEFEPGFAHEAYAIPERVPAVGLRLWFALDQTVLDDGVRTRDHLTERPLWDPVLLRTALDLRIADQLEPDRAGEAEFRAECVVPVVGSVGFRWMDDLDVRVGRHVQERANDLATGGQIARPHLVRQTEHLLIADELIAWVAVEANAVAEREPDGVARAADEAAVWNLRARTLGELTRRYYARPAAVLFARQRRVAEQLVAKVTRDGHLGAVVRGVRTERRIGDVERGAADSLALGNDD